MPWVPHETGGVRAKDGNESPQPGRTSLLAQLAPYAAAVGLCLLLLTFVLWRGFAAEKLVLAAAALLGIVVPLIYLFASPPHHGGYDFDYSTRLISAHWVGVAALSLLIVALGLIVRPRPR